MKKPLLLILLTISIQSAFAQIPSNGLVLHYSFSGSVLDGSGNGFDGTLNGPSLATDRFGNIDAAYDFNGSSDYITIPADQDLQPDFPFTASVWTKIESFGNLTSGSLQDGHLWSATVPSGI